MKPALISLAAVVAMSSAPAWSADAAPGGTTDRRVIAERNFGDVRFVMGEGKSTKWLEMYIDGTYVGGFKDFFVDEIVASPDGKHFLALSNMSKSSYAYAIFDRKGRIEASKPHGGDLHYCNRTSWGSGEWVDTKKPQATFSIHKNQMTTPATDYLQATVRGCDGTTVILARAPAPSLKATQPAALADLPSPPALQESLIALQKRLAEAPAPGTRTPAPNNIGTDRGAFFIGNTIANLRGLDPTFGARMLTLTDGRRVVTTPTAPTFKFTALILPGSWKDLPLSERRTCKAGTDNCSNSVDLVMNRPDGSTQLLATGRVGNFIALPGVRRVFDCAESNGIVDVPVPAIVDLDGNTTTLPSHPGPLHVCTRTGTGNEVMLTYTMAEAGKRFTLARVFDSSGALLAEKTFEKSGALEFSVAGKTYSEEVPGP